ncbi:hypothetical protein [Thermoanaerobacterium thermosaccharolyticum]|uniref:hypothetical protein n=1 Tax=Thermoanaerobacterium thermosaccharolyticum TaxID=1517 RepID=UPI00177A8067|nr:hypothetical protein [Thermoanaerobacterium thermosaccharolyticum]MBE0067689.1 hypothetical protein [Thermoanaerobacterium thermosaccharolyticum]MBE0228512.1 hypothetical protein [Thermoanaerobacterium thermosaccharolyticum]
MNSNKYYTKTALKSDMAIVVVSYDGYSDLWDDFFTLLNKYWGDRPYPTYLANNVKQVNYEGVKVINCGKDAKWSTRTRIAVQQIKEPYICLLLEDYFIGAQVNNEAVYEALDLIKQDGIIYYKLNNFSRVNTKLYNNIDYLYTIPENLEYGVSLQPAIWKRDYLLELIGDEDYTAWEFELDQVKKASHGSNKPLHGCVFDKRNILNICHGVVQGKILPTAIQYFKNKGYNLNLSNREVMSRKEFAYYRLKGIGKYFVPKFLRNAAKNILEILGFRFMSR